MKNSRKVLFFDIDGTLITSKQVIPDSACRALKTAQEQGHLIFINTGRTPYILPKELKEFGFDGFVCGCGTHISLHNEILYESYLPKELCKETLQVLRDCQVPVFFERHDSLYYNDDVLGKPDKKSQIFIDFLGAKPLSSLSEEQQENFVFVKFIAFFNEFSDKEAFRNFIEDKYLYFMHNEDAWEVSQKGCDKASGMEVVLKHLGLSAEDSYAFGDSVNDLAMLKYAGTSIAMGNSMKEILPYCDYQTANVDEDGIYLSLEHFGLLE